MTTQPIQIRTQEQSKVQDLKVALSHGRSRNERQGGWKVTKSTFRQFAAALQNHYEGKKDGFCFLQGECAGGTRKAMAMIQNDIIGIDLDSGKPLVDVVAAVVRAGLEAVIYTTHSHLKDTSQIKRDHFLTWNNGVDPDEDSVRDYLMAKKGLIPEVVRNIEIVDYAHHTEEGVTIVVKHDPIPKFRVVFPLAAPFVFAKRGGTQKDAIAEWKERYAGLCTRLGFFYDETCADPARLFYMPRHPRGAVHDSRWINGHPVKLDDYDRIKAKRELRISSEIAGKAGNDQYPDRFVVEGLNLVGWAKDKANLFECEDFLTSLGVDVLREPRSGKPGVHVICPYEAEHSSLGGNGCFVVNAGDNSNEGFENGFAFKCVHDACSHRDRLDMLKGAIEDGWFTTDDLNATSHLLELEEKEEGEVSKRSTGEKEVHEEPSDGGMLDDETRNITYFNSKYAVVETRSGVRIVRETQDGGVSYYKENDVRLFEKNRFVFMRGKSGKIERMDGFKLWLESPDRRTYKGVIFSPGNVHHGKRYNLFRGFPVRPQKGNWSLFRGHLLEAVCDNDPASFDWLMTWLAHLFQRPGEKPGSALIIRGSKGCGKSIVFDIISEALGVYYAKAADMRQLVGNFNSILEHNLLFVLEEGHWDGAKGSEGILKDLITSPTLRIERKGIDSELKRNFTRLVILSNEDWIVPATADERRYAFFECNSNRRNDFQFFSAMFSEMTEHGGLPAMVNELLEYQPVNGWEILRQPPTNKGLQEQIYETLIEPEKLMFELLQTGTLELDEFGIDPVELSAERETIIYATDLRAALRSHLKQMNHRGGHTLDFRQLERLVQQWLGGRIEKISLPGKPNKRSCYVIPPLEQARAHAAKNKSVRFND